MSNKTEWREAFCPLCGRTMGMKTTYVSPRQPWLGVQSRTNRWEETAEFHGDKPFGVVKSTGGRGSMKMERYYGIDEDQEGYFPLMKARLLAVITEWLAKGWLTNDEVRGIIQ